MGKRILPCYDNLGNVMACVGRVGHEGGYAYDLASRTTHAGRSPPPCSAPPRRMPCPSAGLHLWKDKRVFGEGTGGRRTWGNEKIPLPILRLLGYSIAPPSKDSAP